MLSCELLRADFDVIVSGGGPAGAAAALTLARQGLRTCLLEALPVPRWKIGETLAPEARPLLQHFGVWEEFIGEGHLHSHGICSAWGTDELVEKDFIFNPHGNGWQIDRIRFETMLLKAAEAQGVVVLRGEAVQNCAHRAGGWHLSLTSLTLRAAWLIDATGRRSMLARQLGMPRVMLDRLVSISARASTNSGTDEDGRTLIESRPEGWWYSALTPDRKRTVAFQTDANHARSLEWRDPAWLARSVQKTRFLSALLRANEYHFEGPNHLTSAHSGRLEQCFGEGWFAIGDAAQSYDPLSGQGLLSALTTGRMAAEALRRDWPHPEAAVTEYGNSMNARWEQFMAGRRQFYAMEQRWRDLSFWEERQSPTPATG